MDTNDRLCLICQRPLPEQNRAFCCKEHQEEAKRRGRAYWRKYGEVPTQVKQGLQTLPHKKWELQLPGYWIHNQARE